MYNLRRSATNTASYSHYQLANICRISTRFIHVDKVSEKDRLKKLKQAKSGRPFVAGLKDYKWIQPYLPHGEHHGKGHNYAMFASGTQRATGFVLVIGWTAAALLSFPGLPITILPIVIEAIKTVPIIHGTVKGGIAFSFGYHGVKNYFMPRMTYLDLSAAHHAAFYAITAGLGCAGIAMFVV